MMNHSKFADELLHDFLQHVRALGGDVEPVKVLRSNTYRVGNSHVLARVAADTGKYFFGLNYINAEEVANLDNSFVAFVCGDVGSSVIMPMSELMKLLPQISHDRNGEFKINITKDFELALKRAGQPKTAQCISEQLGLDHIFCHSGGRGRFGRTKFSHGLAGAADRDRQ
jgi:hypothetical protein